MILSPCSDTEAPLCRFTSRFLLFCINVAGGTTVVSHVSSAAKEPQMLAATSQLEEVVPPK